MSTATLAQQMSSAEFIQAAQPTQLFNHGRDWEVFLNGCSLGFADGSLEDALAQVHEREVNNALYANSSDAPEWMKAEMPSAAVLAEYPHVAARFPEVLAMASSQQVADPRDEPLSHQQFNAYIEACFTEMEGHLRSRVGLPARHDWKPTGRELRWNGDDPLRSSLHGASFFIALSPSDASDARQLAIEVRYFWQRRTLQRNGKTEAFGDDQHRVMLWVEQGRPFAGMTKSLLEKSALFFYADDIPTLAPQVATAIGEALPNAVHTGAGSTPALA